MVLGVITQVRGGDSQTEVPTIAKALFCAMKDVAPLSHLWRPSREVGDQSGLKLAESTTLNPRIKQSS